MSSTNTSDVQARLVGVGDPTRDDHAATKKYVDDHGGGGSVDVTDGSTTVTGLTELDFTSGATVTDAGGGVAQVAVSGGSQPQRNVGQAELDFSGFSPAGHVPLAFGSGDATMVDLTDPTYPTVIVPGIYAFLAIVAVGGGNGTWAADLLVDDNYYSIHAVISQSSGDQPWNAMSVSVPGWFCDANDPFQLTITGNAADTAQGSVFVQKIA